MVTFDLTVPSESEESQSESESEPEQNSDPIPILKDGEPNPELGDDPEPESESEPEPPLWGNEDDDPEPEFDDNLSEIELKAAITQYSNWCVENHADLLGVDLSEVAIEVSDKMKRAAGKVVHNKTTGEVTTRYAYGAYQERGWEDFASTVRHELIHVWQIVRFGNADHGRTFKRKAENLGTSVHCEKFSEYEYNLHCTNCDDLIGGRYKKSKIVKQPEKYNSKCCGANLRVEENK